MSVAEPPRTRPHAADASPWTVVAVGIVALAVAMGIGRFAFTPLLPLMLRDGTLDAAAGAEWAAANYAGYLAGALSAARFARRPQQGLRLALAGVTLATLGVAALGTMAPGMAAHAAGLALRALAGVFSAWVLVCTSSWCLAELARRGTPRLGALVYTGVGLGIAAAGLLAWAGGRQPARWLWLELGLLALAGAVFVLRGLRAAPAGAPTPAPAAAPPAAAPAAASAARPHAALVACYGALGFGYIVPATFLPAMARQQVADPLVFGLTWPLFGLAAAASVAAAARWLAGWPRTRVWALAQGTMALGTALPIVSPALGALAGSAVLVGGTFMVATMAGLQLARERAPADPTPLLARMTAAFAVGQIAGPLLVWWLVRMPALLPGIGTAGAAGVDSRAVAWSHAAATALLCLTAAWLWRQAAPPPPPSPRSPAR